MKYPWLYAQLTLLCLVVMAFTLLPTAQAATVSLATAHTTSAPEALVISLTAPPEPESNQFASKSMTQAALNEAYSHFKAKEANGNDVAMQHLILFLKETGVHQDFAGLLIDDIHQGRYQGSEAILQALHRIATEP